MRKCKILIVALLSATILFTSTKVQAEQMHVYEEWKYDTIISPEAGQLVPAGFVTITFQGLVDSDLMIAYYEVYVDEILQETVIETGANIYEVKIYTTEVSSHSIEIVAVSEDAYALYSNSRTFLVSKKGIGLDKNKVMDDMNLSWYYNWDKEPTTTIGNTIEYVPMIWSNYEGSVEWLSQANETYHTVLGFNEPDLIDQANMSPQVAANYQQHFTNSGLRIGAPVVAYDPSNNAWFDEYMSYINIDEIDFIPMHIYYDWGGEGMADALLKAIDDTYEKYQKPIWITEYGLANQWLYQSGNAANIEQIKKYMRDTIAGLEERDYVERYAWFSFGMDNGVGGATALCNQETGELTALGELYKSLGNPTIDTVVEDQYIEQIGYYGKWEAILSKAHSLKGSEEYSLYQQTEEFETALLYAETLDTTITISNQQWIDTIVDTLEQEYIKLINTEIEMEEESKEETEGEKEEETPTGNGETETEKVETETGKKEGSETEKKVVPEITNTDATIVKTGDSDYIGYIVLSFLVLGMYIAIKQKIYL